MSVLNVMESGWIRESWRRFRFTRKKSEELAEKEYARFSKIATQAKLDFENQREEAIQDIKVSRFKVIKLMREISRRLD